MPNLAVNAGPGTGKTYTATAIPRYLRADNKDKFLTNNKHTEEQLAIWEWAHKNIMPEYPNEVPTFLYAAYNADMVPEVTPMVPPVKAKWGVDVRTIHGAGYKVLNRKYGYLRINNNRGVHIVEKLTGQNFYQMKDRFKWLATLKYLEKLKDELLPITPENCELLRAKYDNLANMPIHNDLVAQANKIIVEMKVPDRKLGIEYIDQVWMSLFYCKQPIYDIGIIDEAQDLSPSRLLLVQKLCKHLIFVGDPDQAINAFAGADPHAFDKILDVCKDSLPLKTSFRNPPNIIDKANDLMRKRIVPDKDKRTYLKGIKTEKGKEERLTLNTLPKHLEEPYNNNLIICRYNAPLIACALKLYKASIPCAIMGKSLVSELVRIVEQRKAETLPHLQEKLESYEEFSCKDVKEHIKEVIRDKIDCIRFVVSQCDELDDVVPLLKQLFQPKKNEDHVQLCTIHKSKGKERPNIFILYPPIESTYAQTEDQKQQEQNLHYVAITRTSSNLYWIYRE